ncbi:HAMP domain-containing sensor histidine kinase [Maritimibacter sp. DP1N21-5]|uniref:sensor histidine kinase n=1 Tax=Maritimibacter sp. DP1N21-5 TaxID=2836867 RepID=UPI001C453841|nr:HAMP domain-containing sensor histidine kinase [Maritimibacter sp. DP1N21-5]MBV7410381.1 HAMP domain-containing histidine kinase [Maritimibacter sp. DP1N21-5]
MQNRLLRSTPVRQAMILVAVVALVNLLSLGGAWLKLRADTVAEIKDGVSQDLASFDVAATPSALRTLVAARARVTDPRDAVYVFLGFDQRSTGNAQGYLRDGVIGFEALDGMRLSEAGYVNDSRRLSGGVLIVARSLGPVSELDETFLNLLFFSLIPTVLLSLTLGVWIATRSARRVARIEAVLGRIAGGDLSARTREDGTGDDLSVIGAGVNRMATKQELATETLRQVTTDIAHDLRTPLQRIGVLLSELEERLPEGEEQRLATRAKDEADHAVAVFRALLEIARIEGGRVRERFAPVDLGEVAGRIVELYQPSGEDEGVIISLAVDGPSQVEGDADLIGQALANLIENALRHAGEGGEIAVRVSGDRLSVADRGPGIPEDERDKVLRRLYRLEHSRTTPGNGLGLALVAAIAEAHGAELTLGDNAPGLVVTMRFRG